MRGLLCTRSVALSKDLQVHEGLFMAYLMFRIDALACLSIAEIQWNYGIFKGTDDPSGAPM